MYARKLKTIIQRAGPTRILQNQGQNYFLFCSSIQNFEINQCLKKWQKKKRFNLYNSLAGTSTPGDRDQYSDALLFLLVKFIDIISRNIIFLIICYQYELLTVFYHLIARPWIFALLAFPAQTRTDPFTCISGLEAAEELWVIQLTGRFYRQSCKSIYVNIHIYYCFENGV